MAHESDAAPAILVRPEVEVDVAVVGGGPTGSLAALAAAHAGWRVALIAPAASHDPRTTALLMPAVTLLNELGVWADVAEHTAPLETMRLVDDTDRLPRAPEIAFHAHEVGLEAFGHNVPNDALLAALDAALRNAGVIRVEGEAQTLDLGAPARIAAGSEAVCAHLVVGADGADSVVRTQAGIPARRWRYDQAAFVTTLTHDRDHANVSTEFHTAGGPFTLVPLPGRRSSLVWVGRPDEVARWARLDAGPLAREIEHRAHRILGRMEVDGPRGTFPMSALLAQRFGREGVVLVGEAGHRFPPIGAQGLNLGMRDVAVLRELLADAHAASHLSDDGRGSGSALEGVAERYDRRRRLDVNARTFSVDLMNRSLLTEAMPVAALRAGALAAARRFGPLRKALMRTGLG